MDVIHFRACNHAPQTTAHVLTGVEAANEWRDCSGWTGMDEDVGLGSPDPAAVGFSDMRGPHYQHAGFGAAVYRDLGLTSGGHDHHRIIGRLVVEVGSFGMGVIGVVPQQPEPDLFLGVDQVAVDIAKLDSQDGGFGATSVGDAEVDLGILSEADGVNLAGGDAEDQLGDQGVAIGGCLNGGRASLEARDQSCDCLAVGTCVHSDELGSIHKGTQISGELNRLGLAGIAMQVVESGIELDLIGAVHWIGLGLGGVAIGKHIGAQIDHSRSTGPDDHFPLAIDGSDSCSDQGIFHAG